MAHFLLDGMAISLINFKGRSPLFVLLIKASSLYILCKIICSKFYLSLFLKQNHIHETFVSHSDLGFDCISRSSLSNKIAVGCGNSIFLMSTVQISASVTSGSEAAQTIITLTVTADAPVSGNQTVDLDVSGFDVFPSDYLLSAPTITILDGETEASATFTISDDMVFEGNETATISLTNLSAGLTLGMITSVNISIIDNEFCPSFTTEPDNVTIINSSCDMGCSPAGGEIIAPTGSPCPAGSTIQYFDGSSWSYTLPVYDQDGPAQTISTRCTCDDNTYISSESVPVTTAPASCTHNLLP